MWSLLLAISLAFSTSGVKSPLECEMLIERSYNSGQGKIIEIQPLLTGRGKYATHFNYLVVYKTKNKDKTQNCVDQVYCASYDANLNFQQRDCEE